MKKNMKQIRRDRIKRSIRKRVRGSLERPRLTVYKSLRHIYAQIIDDDNSRTLTAASSLSKNLRESLKTVKDRKKIAFDVGMEIAKKALEKNIRSVVFDRNGYLYHGVVKAIADGVRKGGLEF